MKKLTHMFLIISIAVLFSGCSGVSDDDFDSYNVLSFNLDIETRKVDDSIPEYTSHQETWTVTNNTDRTISGIAFTVCFMDDNDTILSRDSRVIDVSLEPGQSFNQLVFSYDEYESSAVTNYEYELENGRVIGLDLVAETCDYINYL